MSKVYGNGSIEFKENKPHVKMLLKGHYLYGHKKFQPSKSVNMEHSYSRDMRPSDGSLTLSTRTIMVHRPPQCPSCHIHTHDEGVDMEEMYNPPIPSYNEGQAKISMGETEKITKSVKNINQDDVDWETSVYQFNWSSQQTRLFKAIARLLSLDRLARLAQTERQHEPVLRRVVIDKSVERMRQALASVSWDTKLTQWIHGLLMEHLPPTYMTIYLDILQTLKAKVPTLVDKMIFGRPGNINQDVLAPVLKMPWEPLVSQKNRKLPSQPIIVVIPSSPNMGKSPSPRLKKWYTLLATMAAVVPIQLQINGTHLQKQGYHVLTEQMMSVSCAKIQELRNESPSRPIIIVGFHAGAALALQVSMVENISAVVCMGFGYNTIGGVRGNPNDLILEVTAPSLFVIGQNSAKSSQEELESLREQMIAETSLVVVGSADDSLRVSKTKRQIEGVTQTMVDNMVMDEIAEFLTTSLINPPGTRQQNVTNTTNGQQRIGTLSTTNINFNRKRKMSQSSDSDNIVKIKQPKPIGRPRLNKPILYEKPIQNPLLNQTPEALNMAIQSILPDSEPTTRPPILIQTNKNQLKPITPSPTKVYSQYEVIPANSKSKMEVRQIQSSVGGLSVTGMGGTPMMLPMIHRQKVKVIPPNQFMQLKPPSGNSQKVYTLKTSTGIKNGPQLFTVKSQPGKQQVFSVKSTAPQFIPTSTVVSGNQTKLNNSIILNQGKFTLMKNVETTKPDLSNTNIFDIPIVFADNEGNFQENPVTAVQSTNQPIFITSQDGQLINRNIIINNSLANKAKSGNKVVLINRSSLKGQNIIAKTVPQLKYTKVMVSNPNKSKQEDVLMVAGTSTTSFESQKIQYPVTSSSQPNQILNNSLKNTKYSPIVINVDSDKTTFKNIIKVGETQIKPASNTIVFKPGNYKQIPMLKPGILNRNLTVRKVVNIVQKKPVVEQQTQQLELKKQPTQE